MAKPETITKTESVRQAWAKLGKDADADAVLKFVKDSYKIDLSRSHYFNIKTMLTKKSGKKRGRPAKATTEATASAAPAPKVRSAISLDDLQMVKSLTQKYGTDSIRSLLNLVSK